MSDQELISYLDIPFKFWVCSMHPKGQVQWSGNTPKCLICMEAIADE